MVTKDLTYKWAGDELLTLLDEMGLLREGKRPLAEEAIRNWLTDTMATHARHT